MCNSGTATATAGGGGGGGATCLQMPVAAPSASRPHHAAQEGSRPSAAAIGGHSQSRSSGVYATDPSTRLAPHGIAGADSRAEPSPRQYGSARTTARPLFFLRRVHGIASSPHASIAVYTTTGLRRFDHLNSLRRPTLPSPRPDSGLIHADRRGGGTTPRTDGDRHGCGRRGSGGGGSTAPCRRQGRLRAAMGETACKRARRCSGSPHACRW